MILLTLIPEAATGREWLISETSEKVNRDVVLTFRCRFYLYQIKPALQAMHLLYVDSYFSISFISLIGTNLIIKFGHKTSVRHLVSFDFFDNQPK